MISSPSSSSSTAAKRPRGFGASTGFESTSDQDWYIRPTNLPTTATHIPWLMLTSVCIVLILILISLYLHCFEAETWLVSTDLLPVGGVSPDIKNANVDLDCINACFGSVIILDQGILSSAVDPEGGGMGYIECVIVKTIIVLPRLMSIQDMTYIFPRFAHNYINYIYTYM